MDRQVHTFDDLAFNEDGLIPCIVQDAHTRAVLMMAWMDKQALQLTLQQRSMWFFSRSRNQLWHKGETSGNTQALVELRYDCDADTLLALVTPAGPACHTGAESCFFRTLPGGEAEGLSGTEAAKAHLEVGLNRRLGLAEVHDAPDFVCLDMPVSPQLMQPFGFVHGGATLSLLEACASRGAQLHCNMSTHLPFGTHIDVHHVKSCREGTVHGQARLADEQDLGARGVRQVWDVQATDDAGEVLSTGTFTSHVVPLEYLRAKESASIKNSR